MHPAALAVVDRPPVTVPGDLFATWFGALARWWPANAPVAAAPMPMPKLAIGVLGELDVAVDGSAAVDGLRRSRVRTMLELLVVAAPLRRERLADLMWPDLDPDAAAANLRVTLSRLRAVIGGEAVRADSHRVWLGPASAMQVDLWQFEDDIAAADAAELEGDTTSVIRALERACGRWRGVPLVDLDAIDAVAAEVEAVRRKVTAAALRLATLHLDRSCFDAAARWAERVRAAAPYDERAHRVAIAAHIGSGDRAAASDAALLTIATLREIAVEPEAETEAIVRVALSRVRPTETRTEPARR